MKPTRPPAFVAASAVFLIAALASTGFGQDAPTEAAQIPTIPFVDKTFGFDLQVPAGWSYDRAGFFGPGGSAGTLRGAAPGGRQTLQILIFRETKMSAFADWIDFFSKQLGNLEGARSVRVKGAQAADKPAAYVDVRARIGLENARTIYYCVQFDPGTVWVLSYASVSTGTLTAKPEAGGRDKTIRIPPWFEKLVRTLHVFYDPETARRLDEALQRGRSFLTHYGLQDAIGNLRIDESIRYYEIRIAGKPIGYLSRRFSSEREPLQRPGRVSNAKEGLRVRERSYRFADDGTATYTKVDLFSSRDGETDLYEMWDARIPSNNTPDAKVFITRDQCVRERDTLFSTYDTNRATDLPSPRRPLKLDASFLGLSWVRTLPALLPHDADKTLGFTIYDAETRTLITHTIRSLGERPLATAPGGKALLFEMHAGFVETPVLVYTDKFGNMLRLEAGDLVLSLTDARSVDRRFGRLRDQANLRLQQSDGKQ